MAVRPALLLAFLIGVFGGLRSLTAPAAAVATSLAGIAAVGDFVHFAGVRRVGCRQASQNAKPYSAARIDRSYTAWCAVGSCGLFCGFESRNMAGCRCGRNRRNRGMLRRVPGADWPREDSCGARLCDCRSRRYPRNWRLVVGGLAFLGAPPILAALLPVSVSSPRAALFFGGPIDRAEPTNPLR